MENKIPTAESWVNQQFEKQLVNTNDIYASKNGVIEAMIIFAKLHVEQALKEASENAFCSPIIGKHFEQEVNKNSILNSYSFDKIK